MAGSAGPAKLILMTRAPCAAAQSIPLRILKVVPSAPRPSGRRRAWPVFLRQAPRPSVCRARRSVRRWRCRACAAVSGVPSASKLSAIEPASSGCCDVDAGIDHRNQHIVAFGERVRLRQMQLGEFVLRGIAFAFWLSLCLKGKQIIRLRRRDEPVALQRAHNRGDRATVRDAPAVQRRVRTVEMSGFRYASAETGVAGR